MSDFYTLFIEAIQDKELKELYFDDDYNYADPKPHQNDLVYNFSKKKDSSLGNEYYFFNNIPEIHKKGETEMLVHYLRMCNIEELNNARQIVKKEARSNKDINTINRFKSLLQSIEDNEINTYSSKIENNQLKDTIQELQNNIKTLEDAIILNNKIDYLTPAKFSKAQLREHIKSLVKKYSLSARMGKEFVDKLKE
jgi:polyhydroxyalkanoate synthesis regulator phasin